MWKNAKCVTIWYFSHFHAEIIKFGIILTHLSFFEVKWVKKIRGLLAPPPGIPTDHFDAVFVPDIKLQTGSYIVWEVLVCDEIKQNESEVVHIIFQFSTVVSGIWNVTISWKPYKNWLICSRETSSSRFCKAIENKGWKSIFVSSMSFYLIRSQMISLYFW